MRSSAPSPTAASCRWARASSANRPSAQARGLPVALHPGDFPLAVVEAPRATDIVAPTPVDLDAPDAQPVTDLRAPYLPGKPAAAYPGVVVLVHAPEKPADLDLSMAGTLVGTAGFPIGRAVTVPFTVSATNVRYYHAEDAASAAAIAPPAASDAISNAPRGIGAKSPASPPIGSAESCFTVSMKALG